MDRSLRLARKQFPQIENASTAEPPAEPHQEKAQQTAVERTGAANRRKPDNTDPNRNDNSMPAEEKALLPHLHHSQDMSLKRSPGDITDFPSDLSEKIKSHREELKKAIQNLWRRCKQTGDSELEADIRKVIDELQAGISAECLIAKTITVSYLQDEFKQIAEELKKMHELQSEDKQHWVEVISMTQENIKESKAKEELLQKECNLKKKEIETKNLKIEELESEIESLQKTINTQDEAGQLKFKQQIADLTQKKENLVKETEGLKEISQKLESEMKKKQEEIEKFRQKQMKSEDRLHDAKQEKLQLQREQRTPKRA